VPFVPNRAQLTLIDNLTGWDIVLKARQLGMSTAIQAWLFYQHMRGNARTNTLCHDDELTSVLRRMVDRYYDNLPDTVRPPRKYANAKLTTYDALDSEGSIATVGGQAGKKKGRGGSVTHIHGSEVAFWPDAESVMAAAMQAGNPAIVLESTPNGMTGWFYERCMEALAGDSIWTLHFFPWWDDDEYRIPLGQGETFDYTEDEAALVDAHGLDAEQIAWRRLKLRELPHTFAQEYPEDPYSCFLSSGNSFFGDVEGVFTAPMDVEPDPLHRYVAGLDFGQTNDYTVLIVLDTSTNEMVDMLRINRMAWADIRAHIEGRAAQWGAVVWAEENSIGGPNIEAMTGRVKLRKFRTDASSKPALMQGLYVALHESGLRLQPHPELKHELRAFISEQLPSGHWRYEGGNGAHDDTVIALALAWHGAHNAGGRGGSFSPAGRKL
jgi:hypothetical protein